MGAPYFPRGIISKNRRELRRANISGDGPAMKALALSGSKESTSERTGTSRQRRAEARSTHFRTLLLCSGARCLLRRLRSSEELDQGGRPSSEPNSHAKTIAAEHTPLATSIWESTQDPHGTPTEAYLALRGVVVITSDRRPAPLRALHGLRRQNRQARDGRPNPPRRHRRADRRHPPDLST
jgi:hypothetical protein